MHMIFPQNKTKDMHGNQAGVTLLLSVLLLSAITTIAFSLAAVSFAEIATSDDLARTEPIFYHSLGIAEEATYGMKRGEPTMRARLGSECSTSFTNFVVEASAITSKTKLCNLSPDTTIEVAVAQNTAATAVRVYSYDPANGGGGASGYTTLRFKKTTNNGGTVRLYMCRLSEECSDLTDAGAPITGWNYAARILDYNDSVSAPDPSQPYEIVLTNTTGPKEYIEITTAPKGLPYLNKESIEVQSEYGRLIRRLRVLVPAQ